VTIQHDLLSNGRHLRPAASIDSAAARDGVRPAAAGCPVAHMRAGLDEADGAGELPKELRSVHAVTRELLQRFSLADAELMRQLQIQLQRLEQAIASDADQTGTTHQLAGVCRFQLQQYGAAVAHFEVACAKQPERTAWALLLGKARASAQNALDQRRAPLEPFRAEHLTNPAALYLREPEGVALPPGPSPRDVLVDKARALFGVLARPVMTQAIRAVGALGSQRTWQLEEGLSTGVMGQPKRTLGNEAKAFVADMMLGYLRMQMNRDTLQDPYAGDLAGFAPPGQRRPEWTRYLPTADGSWRTDDPNMGKAGTRFPMQGVLDANEFANNRALDPSLPNPRLVSRTLLAPEGPRKEAPFLNLLAAAWIQFQVHGWFNHRQLPAQEGMLRFPLDEDDPIRRGA
jgi:hypothetical protein